MAHRRISVEFARQPDGIWYITRATCARRDRQARRLSRLDIASDGARSLAGPRPRQRRANETPAEAAPASRHTRERCAPTDSFALR